MKKIRKYIYLLLIFSYVSFTSCEDFALGEKFLQKPPSGDVTIDTIFSTAEYARRVLWYAYSKLPYGFSTGYNNSTSMRMKSLAVMMWTECISTICVIRRMLLFFLINMISDDTIKDAH